MLPLAPGPPGPPGPPGMPGSPLGPAHNVSSILENYLHDCVFTCVCLKVNLYLVVQGVQDDHLILAGQGHQGDRKYLSDPENPVHLKNTHKEYISNTGNWIVLYILIVTRPESGFKGTANVFFSYLPGSPESPLAPFITCGVWTGPGAPGRPGSPLSPLMPEPPGEPSLPGNPGSPREEKVCIRGLISVWDLHTCVCS